jgi:hypothetical protein
VNWRRGPLRNNSLFTADPVYHVIIDIQHFPCDSSYAANGIREGWLELIDYKVNGHGNVTNYYRPTPVTGQ